MKTKITGHDLIALGYRQGKWMKAALEHINDNALEGDALWLYYGWRLAEKCALENP